MVLVFSFLKIPSTQNYVIQKSIRAKLGEFDFIGSFLIIGGILCLFLALLWGGQQYPWRSSMIIGLFAGSIAILVLLIWAQRRLGDKATIPPRIFKQRTMLSSCFYLLFCYMGCYTVCQWTSITIIISSYRANMSRLSISVHCIFRLY